MAVGARVAAIVASCAVAAGLGAGAAHGAAITFGGDGQTAPVFDYNSSIRERVFIPQPGIDQDGDGVDDQIALEIMRPAGTDPGEKVPVLIDPSPYYSTVCRTRENQCIGDTAGGTADGVNDRWPQFYDNYFVPRGYAYILAESNGTANSTGNSVSIPLPGTTV